jgi:hypothetical protein
MTTPTTITHRLLWDKVKYVKIEETIPCFGCAGWVVRSSLLSVGLMLSSVVGAVAAVSGSVFLMVLGYAATPFIVYGAYACLDAMLKSAVLFVNGQYLIMPLRSRAEGDEVSDVVLDLVKQERQNMAEQAV